MAFFSAENKKTIEVCCRLIQFKMSLTLLVFRDKYFKYNRGSSIDEKNLAIGGYETVFLADLVASYLFELSRDKFYLSKYYSIYCDDGIVVFNGKWTVCHTKKWLLDFQSHINTIAGNAHLIFTAAIWSDNPYDQEIGKIKVIREKSFPYLDMELYWDYSNYLRTRVYRKPNQALKYLNQGSTHTLKCLKAIPLGIFRG